MNEPEAFQLLTLASARDNRAVSPSIAKVWADDLSDVTLVDATVALREHYREKPDVWLLPGHVLAGAKRIWAERARKWRIQQQIEARTEDKPFPMMTLAQAVEIEKQRTLDREKQSRIGSAE